MLHNLLRLLLRSSKSMVVMNNSTSCLLKCKCDLHKLAFEVPLVLWRVTDRLLAAALGSAENGTASTSMEMASVMPPRYVDFKEQIRTEMYTIKQRMHDLRHLHGKAALTNFDDTDSNEAEIDVITQEITRLFRKCEARLQQFTGGPPGSEADEKVQEPSLCLLHNTPRARRTIPVTSFVNNSCY